MPNPTPDSLSHLISRCALKDREAFVLLYRATSAKLFGVILRILKVRPWAEETLQESYMKIWRHAESYNAGRGTPMTWMINIARNQALDFLRQSESRAKRQESVGDDQDIADTQTLEQQVEVNAELARLRRCLEGLAEAQRRCVLLVHHDGYAPTEVAKRESLPLGTVKTWIRRGLMRLRECLSQ